MEYSHTSRLKFRMGYEPRDSAVPDNKRNILAPINSAKMFGRVLVIVLTQIPILI
jgi:hypothetical protein